MILRKKLAIIERMDKKSLGWSLSERNPQTIKQLMPIWQWLYEHYFRVTTDGWENIPEGQVLLVGSHNGGLASPDMSMMIYDWFRCFGTERLVYGLMHPTAWTIYPELAKIVAQVGAVQAHPRMAIAALDAGASVLVYPGGAEDVFRPYGEREKIKFVGRTGFIKLALRYSLPIVPLIARGAHETLFVIADIYKPIKQLNEWGLLPWIYGIDPKTFPIYLGLPWGLAIGPLLNIPLPQQIHTRVCKPIYFERYGNEASRDRQYVTECYEKVVTIMQKELDLLYMSKDYE